ncbi:MAG: toll/interleukin-1 receptor domain-containing protein [Planctomycetota bacterium]|jgi:hypothetical protein
MATEQRDVFLCHASEDKLEIVEALVQALSDAGISYWYDEAEIIWGDSITQKVNEGLRISRYVVVVLSQSFIAKNWAQRELNAALNIEAESGNVRVLPLLVGNNEEMKRIIKNYPILSDKFYLKWSEGITKIIEALKERLSICTPSVANESTLAKKKPFDIPMPEIKKKFSQRDKDLFLKKSFEIIKSYFQNALSDFESQYPEVETDFTELHRFKFTSTIYISGEIKSKCKIWLGGPLSSNSIAYNSGYFDIDLDNSCNGWVTVTDDGRKLGFEPPITPFGSPYTEKSEILGPEQAAECFWRRFTENLNEN